MAAICKTNELLTSIDLFKTASKDQQDTIAQLSNYVSRLTKTQSGCVSGSIHRSIDGERAMCYLQWQKEQYYTDFNKSQSGYKELDLLDTHLYEVAVSKPDDADLTIQPGRLLHLGEFRLLPENQPRLIALEAEIPEISLQHPDLLSVNFHRSLDGTRTMNYGFWSNFDRFDLLLKEERFKPVRDYWQGLAENEFHLYEVAGVFEQR
ncbi:antibiotic biosynthesis monooxygenase [Pseudanabaena sp. FACHB-2040]|uniref:antibiotic biosynthesis monooxygenase n=1 Tax=Pseudanabaena sp. FACHB-2040 TaxID=2692859 RepID=UPI0016822AAC|nr:antibiotic biosynthesis monooxygenase [Pseudanabaena sp. FACHB-2040]MBD2256038.1 antibiotic biosynthesis monooxygenase [Pseudanabaena sp. FACHB-2040]